MKKIIAVCLWLLVFSTGFAENIMINNKTPYPSKNQSSKIAIQWATTGREIQKANKDLIYGLTLDPGSLQPITKSGKLELNMPKNAKHFRVLVWSKDHESPDFLTNWINIIHNASYTLETDQLISAVLMSGAGC